MHSSAPILQAVDVYRVEVKLAAIISPSPAFDTSSPRSAVRRKVYAQLSSVVLLGLQELRGSFGALDVDKVGMCKASWLTGSPIDCHSDVQDILDLAEQVIEILVAHFVGEVTDEQRLRGRVDELVIVGWGSSGGLRAYGILHDQASTLEDLAVECIAGSGGTGLVIEFYIAEPGANWSVSIRHIQCADL